MNYVININIITISYYMKNLTITAEIHYEVCII